MFVSLRLAYAVVPEEVAEPLANLRTQLDGFTAALPQVAMSQFMEEGHFSAHLRRMRAAYGAKRAELVEGASPARLARLDLVGQSRRPPLLVRHPAGAHVRAIPAASSLDLALLTPTASGPRVTRGCSPASAA